MKQIKKQFVWILCVALCLFSLAGCSKSGASGSSMDPSLSAYLAQTGEGLLQEVTSMSQSDLNAIVDQQAATPGVLAGVESYLSLQGDLGAFVSLLQGSSVSETDDGYEVSVWAQFENRRCEFVVDLDEELSEITSMTFNPEYTLGETMTKAALNTLMGMGTVFIVLIFISLLISCFKYISVIEKKMKEKSAPAPAAVPAAPVPAPAPEAVEEDVTDDLELVAVITAAIAVASENVSADGLVVRSIRRVPGSKWKNA